MCPGVCVSEAVSLMSEAKDRYEPTGELGSRLGGISRTTLGPIFQAREKGGHKEENLQVPLRS